MRIPILRGRNLAPGEPRSVVVSESLARLRWPAEDPVGKPFRIGADGPGANNFTVVGVAGSARLVSPEDSDAAEVYQFPDPGVLPMVVVLVRTSTPPEGLIRAVASTECRVWTCCLRAICR